MFFRDMFRGAGQLGWGAGAAWGGVCYRAGEYRAGGSGAWVSWALIVNLASIAGVDSPPWLSIYGATKAAVIGFSKSTQKELMGTGVAVTAICPGFVATDMTEFAQQAVPAEEMMQPEDIAEAVSFLLKVSPACAVPELVMARPVAGPETQGM